MIVEELALFFVSLFSNLCFETLLEQKIQQKQFSTIFDNMQFLTSPQMVGDNHQPK